MSVIPLKVLAYKIKLEDYVLDARRGRTAHKSMATK